jgi:hypothetical protein
MASEPSTGTSPPGSLRYRLIRRINPSSFKSKTIVSGMSVVSQVTEPEVEVVDGASGIEVSVAPNDLPPLLDPLRSRLRVSVECRLRDQLVFCADAFGSIVGHT